MERGTPRRSPAKLSADTKTTKSALHRCGPAGDNLMKGYKAPSFQDRAASSLQAKEKALAKLKAMPQPDAAELAERAARQAERDAVAAAKSAKAREAREEKQRLAEEKRAQAKADKIKAEQPKRTEEQLKAARDARYAARKSRK
ncbi:DUF6481 family protein [Porphyrobacter sp. YT40]|uniref:DUF6481 family protein n=1 Tax=Porphyrobacter sp. YT40 TaxID=2547601 RepID=UPI0025741B67|nr:DUF6481 family protein [Porphyrobacter sp. YT40]